MQHILIQDPLNKGHAYLIFRVVSEYIIFVDDDVHRLSVESRWRHDSWWISAGISWSWNQGLDPFARASTSEALSASSQCTRLLQFLSDADKECLVTKSVLICVILAYFTIATLSSALVEEIVGVDTTGGAPPVVVVGDDGENIVGLLVVGLLIGVAFPKINSTVWSPSWMIVAAAAWYLSWQPCR